MPDIKVLYGQDNDEVIDSYFAFLLDRELGFWSEEKPDDFPPVELSWYNPEKIRNAIIDIDSSSCHDYNKILGELDDLGCKAIEFRFFRSASISELRQLMDETRGGRLRSISLAIGWSGELTPDSLAQFASDYPRVDSIVIHTSPVAGRFQLKSGVVLHYRLDLVSSPSCCGQIHPGYFAVNMETFSEAQSFNTCLNRKISVDAGGEIRNCPSLPKSFGNVKTSSLPSALAQSGFADLWTIRKDQIKICQDCEFRYICTDCRAYLSDARDLYSKPAKCNYNPYTAEWTSGSDRLLQIPGSR